MRASDRRLSSVDGHGQGFVHRPFVLLRKVIGSSCRAHSGCLPSAFCEAAFLRTQITARRSSRVLLSVNSRVEICRDGVLTGVSSWCCDGLQDGLGRGPESLETCSFLTGSGMGHGEVACDARRLRAEETERARLSFLASFPGIQSRSFSLAAWQCLLAAVLRDVAISAARTRSVCQITRKPCPCSVASSP